MPKLKRGMPLTPSMPTVEINTPTTVEMMILKGDPLPKTVSRPKAMTARPKYSAGPKRSASLARAGAKDISRTMEAVPAMNDPMAAIESAAPARPFWAIW